MRLLRTIGPLSALVCTLFALLLPATVLAAGEGWTFTQLSPDTVSDQDPVVSGDRVVWAGSDGSDQEIYMWTPAGGTQQLSFNSDWDRDPQVDGDRVVWWRSTVSGTASVMMWTPTGGTETLPSPVTDNEFPQVSGDRVVWTGNDGTDQEVFTWTPSGGTVNVTNDGVDEYAEGVSGDRIIWQGYTDSGWDLFTWTATGGEERITTGAISLSVPMVSGDRVAWTASDGDFEVFTWTPAGGVVQLTNDTTYEYLTGLSGDRLIWDAQDPAPASDHEIYTWTPGGQTVRITNNTTYDEPTGVSGDRISAMTEVGGYAQVALWTPAGGLLPLTSYTFYSYALPQVSGTRLAWKCYQDFRYKVFTAKPAAPPTITGISPASGSTNGGTTVTITGTNFLGLSGAAAVRFGGTNAVRYTVDSPTQITAVSPGHVAGVASVRVAAAGGTNPDTSKDDFLYIATPPTVTAITPASGYTGGGIQVVISGTNLYGVSGAAGVTFGGTNAMTYTVNSSTKITAVTPAHAAGTVNVLVTAFGGTSSGSGTGNDFTYSATIPPIITSVVPATGFTAGGTEVVINGSNFTGLSGSGAVRIGGVDAIRYVVNSSTKITAITPAHASGRAEVVVTGSNGTSSIVGTANDFTYKLDVYRASVSSAGAQGNNDSYNPSMAGGGRYVSFTSFASNLVTGDTNGYADVFVRDRVAGTTQRVSVSSTGAQANGAPNYESYLSADGRYVAFTSAATNLVTGDTNGCYDVFLHDMQTGETSRVSVSSSGAQALNGYSTRASLSADGRYVAFDSNAGNLVSGDTGGYLDVFVRDRVAGTTTRISRSTGGTAGNGDSWWPSISADGRYVSYVSSASNLVPGDTNNALDVFLFDRTTSTTTRLSVSSTGAQSTDIGGDSGPASLSADGRYAVFYSSLNQLVAADSNRKPDVFVRDRVAGTTTRISVSTSGAEGNDMSRDCTISADGRWVAFDSTASTLVSGDTNGKGDVFIRDRLTNTTTRLSVADGGVQANGYSSLYLRSMSADGGYVAFSSDATNLLPGDTNGFDDVFVKAAPAAKGIPPAVTALSPSYGSPAGGTAITITGTAFLGATAVKFGATAATNVKVVSATTITATIPAHSAGRVDVTVTTPAGTSWTAGSGNDYSYLTHYEQTDARLFFAGTWSLVSATLASGGTYTRASTNTAYAVIPFTGDRVDWIMTKGTSLGSASLSVDGKTPVNVSLYNANGALYKQRWTTGSLSTVGQHFVKISWYTGNTAGRGIDVDAVQVRGSLLAATRVQETDARLVYAPAWTPKTSTSASGGTYRFTNTAGAKVTITFTGIGVVLLAEKAPTYGKASISVDGGTPVLVDLYSLTTVHLAKAFAAWVPYGTHTVVITRSGQRNGSSGGYGIDIDAVDVWGALK